MSEAGWLACWVALHCAAVDGCAPVSRDCVECSAVKVQPASQLQTRDAKWRSVRLAAFLFGIERFKGKEEGMAFLFFVFRYLLNVCSSRQSIYMRVVSLACLVLTQSVLVYSHPAFPCSV